MKNNDVVTVEEVKEAVEKVGYQYIADRPVSNHVDDWYLRIVLARREEPRKEMVTWVYNRYSGLVEGMYTQNEEYAREHFLTRY